MPNPTPDSYVFTPGVTLYVGQATPGGSLLTTLTLVNTSGSEQAANFVAPMFGQPFVQGDVPSGQYPAFELTDGTPCPATIHSVTTWPDGSMKWCGVLLRVPTTIAGSGSLTINVKNGGSAPSASSRATSDLTAADLSTVLTGVTNLTGEWTASLNTAITDATDIVSLGDGPAGRIWRIGGPFKQSGSAHGQLHCWHYVAALQNSSGGLLGLRYLGRAAQPWADVSSPTPTRRVLTAALKSGSTTLRSLQGHDTTETPGANIGMGHYTSFFTAGTDGKWDFVQGGGSASADCTVRVQHDKTYFTKTRVIPSYDLSISAISSSSSDYIPYGRAQMTRAIDGTGEREDIGLMTTWSVRHLLTQAAVDERVVRVTGLCSGGWRVCARRSTTGEIVPVTDPAPTYTGLGTVQPTWRLRASDANTGYVTPTVTTSLWQSETEPSHRPAATYYAYLITGEPQYLDMLVEQAANLIANKIPGQSSVTVSNPVTTTTLYNTGDFGERDIIVGATTYKGGGHFYYGNLTRVIAWGWRDIAEAAGIYPDVCPKGTEVRKYLRDYMASSIDAINDYNSRFGTGWSELGMICFDSRPESANPWCHAYLTQAICHAATLVPSAAHTALRQFVAQFWENVGDALDIANAFSFGGNMYDGTLTRTTTKEGFLFTVGTTLTFSTATNRATISALLGNNGSWSPTNGDVFAFATQYDSDKPYTGVSDFQRLYAVNCSGQTFQLATTPGGAPLTVNNNVVLSACAARIQNFEPNLSFEGPVGRQQYISSVTAAIRLHAAVGDNVADAVTKSNAKIAAASISYAENPKYAMSSSYPA